MDKINPRKAISARLKHAREKAGYHSGEDFCEKNKLPACSYLAYENGKVALKISQIKKYCKLLDISLRWVMLNEE